MSFSSRPGSGVCFTTGNAIGKVSEVAVAAGWLVAAQESKAAASRAASGRTWLAALATVVPAWVACHPRPKCPDRIPNNSRASLCARPLRPSCRRRGRRQDVLQEMDGERLGGQDHSGQLAARRPVGRRNPLAYQTQRPQVVVEVKAKRVRGSVRSERFLQILGGIVR
jgi:hypothetical protein